MEPRPSQVQKSNEALELLRKHKIAYLAMEERTGKTLTAILACERLACTNVLVLTKKKALSGWQETLAAYSHLKRYTVTNYHQAVKLLPVYDLIILDEAHNYISAFPKRGAMWKTIRQLTKGRAIIYMSATPNAQGIQMLFNQFALSDWSPWRKWTSPYSWFRDFGEPNLIYLAGRKVEQYNRTKEGTHAWVEHLFITATRKQLGFVHEPEDMLHYVKLDDNSKHVYNLLSKIRALELNGHMIICDSITKLRTSLHQLEGGTLKVNKDVTLQLGNDEKVQYIKQKWGDSIDLAIMYHFKGERAKLEAAFSKATLLQATSNAEGVDLHNIATLVIYSQDYSTARFSQRRARQANFDRAAPIIVHFLLVKKAISEQVYTTVAENKRNFIDSTYKEHLL